MEKMSIPTTDDITIEALSKLFETHGPGLTGPQLKQTRVPLGALRIAPRVFQPRDMNDATWTKQQHIDLLVKQLEHGRSLDNIDVFPVNGIRFVVDGHCRVQAYRKAGREDSDSIPVRHFVGSFGEALRLPAKLNSKDKLSFTRAEKLEAAWRMVCYDEHGKQYSVRGIADDAGIGHSTVANMRAALTEPLGFDPRGRTWAEVLSGRRGETEYSEGWEDKLSQAWAVRLRKTFGDKPDKQQEIFVWALQRAYPRACEMMRDQFEADLEGDDF